MQASENMNSSESCGKPSAARTQWSSFHAAERSHYRLMSPSWGVGAEQHRDLRQIPLPAGAALKPTQ
jgi:hypothetical protein